MTIKETFLIDIFESSDEEFPDQNAEYRTHKLETSLVAFVNQIASRYSDSDQEDRAICFSVAVKLLESFQSRIQGDLLTQRFVDRKKT